MLSSVQRLRAVYGEREARRVIAATDQLVQAREARGIATRLVLCEPDGPNFENAAEVARKFLASATEHIESLLILGGPAIIPFELASNPTEYDGDNGVPTDRIYGSRTADALMPEWAVGRLPGAETASARADLLVRFIQQAARLHAQPARDRFDKTFGYSTAAWREASSYVYREISASPLVLSPPTVASTLDQRVLQNAGAVYCNLHGVRDGAAWYGQDEASGSYIVALRAEDVLRANFNGALVLSEACYGAAITGQDERSSMALAFLRRGAAGFVGATAMAYGPAAAPLSEADLIALHFWRAVRAANTTIGAALVEARARMLLETLTRQPALDDDDRKTALEFVLYGDPTLAV